MDVEKVLKVVIISVRLDHPPNRLLLNRSIRRVKLEDTFSLVLSRLQDSFSVAESPIDLNNYDAKVYVYEQNDYVNNCDIPINEVMRTAYVAVPNLRCIEYVLKFKKQTSVASSINADADDEVHVTRSVQDVLMSPENHKLKTQDGMNFHNKLYNDVLESLQGNNNAILKRGYSQDDGKTNVITAC